MDFLLRVGGLLLKAQLRVSPIRGPRGRVKSFSHPLKKYFLFVNLIEKLYYPLSLPFSNDRDFPFSFAPPLRLMRQLPYWFNIHGRENYTIPYSWQIGYRRKYFNDLKESDFREEVSTNPDRIAS